MSEDLTKKHGKRLDEIAQRPVRLHREKFRMNGLPQNAGAGKGDARRPFNRERYYRGHERAFRKRRRG